MLLFRTNQRVLFLFIEIDKQFNNANWLKNFAVFKKQNSKKKVYSYLRMTDSRSDRQDILKKQ